MNLGIRSVAWIFLAVLALAAFSLIFRERWAGPQKLPVPERVVLVTIDTLRADHMGIYGYPRDTTPFLDSLARSGVVFSQGFATSAHTAPSHASLLTGLIPAQHRVFENGNVLKEDRFSLARMFGELGYETAAFVAAGFLRKVAVDFDLVDAEKPTEGRRPYRTADQTMDRVADWLEARRPDEKFFLWIHLYDIHEYYLPEFTPKTQFRAMAKSPVNSLVAFVTKQHNIPRSAYSSRRELATVFNHYDAQLRLVDDELRRLYSLMDESGHNRRALWIITSDHGEGLGNHGHMGHGKYIYQEQLRVPLILNYDTPGLSPRAVPSLVRHVDILPTLAEIFAYPLDSEQLSLSGRSLLPALTGPPEAPAPGYSFAHRLGLKRLKESWGPGEVYSLHDLRFKYIYHSEGEDEFYDLQADPFEEENLFEQSAAAGEASKMREVLLGFVELGAPTDTAGSPELDEEEIEELKALGYL